MADHTDHRPTGDFNRTTGGSGDPPPREIRSVARPVTKQQIDTLHKQLSEPRIALEYTMEGATTRQIRTERDKAILKEIEAIRAKLAARRHAAKEAFQRGVNNTTVRRPRTP